MWLSAWWVVLPAPAAGEEVTFSKDVAPILHRSCVQCHRPGSIAPMSLISYEDARQWARAIREKTSLAPDEPERVPGWLRLASGEVWLLR